MSEVAAGGAQHHGAGYVETATVPAWVASSGKISDRPRGSPIKTVIQITQAMLDDQSTEDTPTSKMMPYRPQTPL